MPASPSVHPNKPAEGGKLRIGDDWNAIRIIALSQSNPLKAIAEFVENSIDAHASSVTITRGREGGAHYLSIKDDGDGVPRDDEGLPNFKYVATHICDSIKRRLKTEGNGSGLQGEFGIGLLSFWTVGNTLTMTSAGADQRAYQMAMSKGDSRYKVTQRRVLFAEGGTELKISPLLEGIRSLSGEKIQWFLASELRDRLRTSGVRVRVIDKLARKQYEVEPRAFEGRLLHQLPAVRTPYGDAYAELYLAQPGQPGRVALTRSGTRVVEHLASLPGLEDAPWSSRYLQGLIDAPFLNLTPGTRSGIIHDERYAALLEALKPLETSLNALIEAQQKAEDEQASQQSLRAIQRAFREALLALPPEEYDWFEVQARSGIGRSSDGSGVELRTGGSPAQDEINDLGVAEPTSGDESQRHFFDYAGPLYAVVISPATSTVPVNERRRFRALPRDRSRRRVADELAFAWEIVEGEGTSIDNTVDQEVEFTAGAVARPRATARHRDPGRGRMLRRGLGDGHRQPRRLGGLGCRQQARPARVHIRAGRRRALALPIRYRAQCHRRQQRTPRLRFRDQDAGPAAAIFGAAVRQGAGAEELCRNASRAVARAHGRAFSLRGGKTQDSLLMERGFSPFWNELRNNDCYRLQTFSQSEPRTVNP